HRPALARKPRRQALPAHPARRGVPQPGEGDPADVSEGEMKDRPTVVLSEAKDLIAACNRHEILRFAQDDFRTMERRSTLLSAMSKSVSPHPRRRAKEHP